MTLGYNDWSKIRRSYTATSQRTHISSSPIHRTTRGLPIDEHARLVPATDHPGNRPLQVSPLRLPWQRHVPDIVHVQLPVASSQRGTPAVLAIPLQFIDSASLAHRGRNGWHLRSQMSEQARTVSQLFPRASAQCQSDTHAPRCPNSSSIDQTSRTRPLIQTVRGVRGAI